MAEYGSQVSPQTDTHRDVVEGPVTLTLTGCTRICVSVTESECLEHGLSQRTLLLLHDQVWRLGLVCLPISLLP